MTSRGRKQSAKEESKAAAPRFDGLPGVLLAQICSFLSLPDQFRRFRRICIGARDAAASPRAFPHSVALPPGACTGRLIGRLAGVRHLENHDTENQRTLLILARQKLPQLQRLVLNGWVKWQHSRMDPANLKNLDGMTRLATLHLLRTACDLDTLAAALPPLRLPALTDVRLTHDSSPRGMH